MLSNYINLHHVSTRQVYIIASYRYTNLVIPRHAGVELCYINWKNVRRNCRKYWKRERLVLRRGTQKGGKLQARNKELLLLPAPDCQDTRRENLPGVADRSVHPDKTLQVQASPHTAVGFLLRQRGDECCYAPTQSIFILKVREGSGYQIG